LFFTQVKALGTLAMIDEGELDWKVIGVSTADPKVVVKLVYYRPHVLYDRPYVGHICTYMALNPTPVNVLYYRPRTSTRSRT
jgi:hypothetical protein